jgi:signal transduction histidine kinase
MSYSLNNIGLIYFETEDYENALTYLNQSLEQRRRSGDKWGEAGSLDNIGVCYLKMRHYEKAIDFCARSLNISTSVGDQKGQGNSLFHLGNIYEHSGQYDKALDHYEEALQIRSHVSDKKGEAEISLFLAELYAKEKFSRYDIDKAIGLMNNVLLLGNELKANDLLSKIHYGFYKICKKNDQHEEALAHLEKYITTEKEIHNAAINKKILNLEISHGVEKSRQEAEMYKLRNIELANLYEQIKRQKEETEIQKKNTEEALIELKATQAQLIQSEKMASLGELTAGIAHEIQNPLNFVNNFSEVNAELVDELKTELAMGNAQSADKIADSIRENEQKISHHGKRADAIVKGMLQHSRTSGGQKESTEINALVDEYWRLAYHGLRAKDKSFNAKIEADFDSTVGQLNIVPQDIGRVILNLINNAFYAVNEKQKTENDKFEPCVSVRTRRLNDKIEITVADNGNGIPEKILDKIFQPFFTTKPTGQGTGLGLSLAYDIVKAHGGEIKVESKEGAGSEFIVHLPHNTTK